MNKLIKFGLFFLFSTLAACSSTNEDVAKVEVESKVKCNNPNFIRTQDRSVKGNSEIIFTHGSCSKHFGLTNTSSKGRLVRAEQRQQKNIAQGMREDEMRRDANR